jgi:Sulfotransferase family
MKSVLEQPREDHIAENIVGTGGQVTIPQSSGPVFLIGMWRSGTSLFYVLLNQHPQIALMYEGDLLLLRPLFWLPGATARWVKRWQFWNQALSRHNIEPEEFKCVPFSFCQVLEKAYRETARRKGASIWGEKSPNYYSSLVRLSRDFPGARFIVIWRDPAAVCLSILNAGQGPSSWFNRRGMAIRTILGCKVMKNEYDRLISRGIPVHQVQYESLVRDPEATMIEVCRFLGVQFVPAMASLEAADRSAVYQGQHHALVNGEEIVSARARKSNEMLPPALKTKIARYVALWREESNGQWPACTLPDNSSKEKPSFWEKLTDRYAYRYFRTVDFCITLAYSFAPIWLLAAWREFRYQNRAAGTV